MTEQELYNEYRKSDCKSFTDFLINKITELKKIYRKQRNKRIDELQKENKELKEKLKPENCLKLLAKEGYVKFTSEQLTKAKEIIRDLINLTEPTSTEEVQHWNETFRKAEKFLSEVEK